MNSEYLKYEQKFVTAVDEVDYREMLKPSALLQYFQDLATAHAVELGIGYRSLLEKDMCWVISRLSYRVKKYPALGEEVTAVTYPKNPRIVDVNRDYYVTDSNGNVVITGTSKWCVIGISDRTIKKCRDLFLYTDDMYRPDSPFEDANGRVPPLGETGAQIKQCGEFNVRISDLDRNFHMNNARYGDAVLNSCSVDELNENFIESFDINYVSELFLGDKFIVNRADVGGETYFEALKSGDGKVVFRAKIGWQKRNDDGI